MSTKRKNPPAQGSMLIGRGGPQVPQLLAQALAFHQKGQLAQAGALYQRILQVQPAHFDALHLLGSIAAQSGSPGQAVDLLGQAISINPRNADAYYNRGNALRLLGQFEAALKDYDKAIALKPGHADAFYNRGLALRELGRDEAALQSYDRSIALAPGHADVHYNRGNVLRELKRPQEALESYNRAIALQPNYVEAHCNRGLALEKLHLLQAALDDYNQAIALKPDYAEAYCNRGNVLLSDQPQAALADYNKAIALKPDFPEAHLNRGDVLLQLKQPRAAMESYDLALALDPDHEFLYGRRLHAQLSMCEWEGSEERIRRLAAGIDAGEKLVAPFLASLMLDSPSTLKKAAAIYAQSEFPAMHALPAPRKYPRHGRIRIGYFSADFYNHATSYLMAELFERHDRSRFELTAFSFGPDKNDETRQRIAAAFDSFIDLRQQSDLEIARLARKLEIDIAVDLGGFTRNNRTGIFALRAAPIQVNYLVYPGTMGAEYMDYLIADPTLVPQADRQFYTEKIACLPDCYQPSDTTRPISSRQFTRQELELPQDGFVFCCFNNTPKITPQMFGIWMRILGRVSNSVLWLLEDNPETSWNLRREAARFGIAESRLIFAKRMPSPEHLARHRLAGLFLDTFPYNAHTTASDALWLGLPLLTCPGKTFASRVAASLLHAIDLPELIAPTLEQYEALAVELATDPARLAQLREKLAHNRLTAPLFDMPRFTRHLETIYAEMYERCQADLPPEHIGPGNRVQESRPLD